MMPTPIFYSLTMGIGETKLINMATFGHFRKIWHKHALPGLLLLLILVFASCDDTDDRPVIVCWGDSLTAPHNTGNDLKSLAKRIAGRDKSYPEILQDMVGDKYRVINCGVGGERTLEIMARQGSLPLMLAHDVTIYDREHAKFPIFLGNEDIPSLVTVWHDSIRPLQLLRRGWEVGMPAYVNPVLIDSVAYMIKNDFHYWTDKPTDEPVSDFIDKKSICFNESNTYLIPKELPERTITLPKGTVLETAASRELRDADINIFYLGGNGDYKSLAEFVEQLQTMVDYAYSDNYYIATFHHPNSVFDTYDKLVHMEDSLSSVFGNRYINLRRELGTPSHQPVSPTLLLADKTHFNSKGRRRIAKIIYAHITNNRSGKQ